MEPQANCCCGQEWQAGGCYLVSFRGPRGGRDCLEVLCSFLGTKSPRRPGCPSLRLPRVRRYGKCGVERSGPLREDISLSLARCLYGSNGWVCLGLCALQAATADHPLLGTNGQETTRLQTPSDFTPGGYPRTLWDLTSGFEDGV